MKNPLTSLPNKHLNRKDGKIMVKVISNLTKILILSILITLTITGCRGISSQYILTCEYSNPNTNNPESIEVPVSQYEYERTKVGTDYTVTIHTAILGIRTPITRQTTQSQIALLDTMPTVFPLAFLVIPLVYLYRGIKGKRKECLIPGLTMLIVALGASYLLISTTSPEFTVVSTVVDKTFRIVG